MTISNITFCIPSNHSPYYEVNYFTEQSNINQLYYRGWRRYNKIDKKKADWFWNKYIMSKSFRIDRCMISTLNHTRLPFKVNIKQFRAQVELLKKQIENFIKYQIERLK